MRHILILGAGKSSYTLINTLLEEANAQEWMVHVADAHLDAAMQKINGHAYGIAHSISMNDGATWHHLIEQSDVIISMLPPFLHKIVALQCLRSSKHFLNASYLTEEINIMDKEASDKGLLFLCEMGLDPGIDHMSAMDMINIIQEQGGEIHSFRSHCGGLISPESDDNPWHYKISWNPRNIITAGKDGARFLQDGRMVEMSYLNLFDSDRRINIPDTGSYAWYPNRDSIPYQLLYGLENAKNLVRTTLRHPDFCEAWNLLVNSGLTSEKRIINTDSISYKDYLNQMINNNLITSKLMNQLAYAGLLDDNLISMGNVSPADILEKKLSIALRLHRGDRDMIIMLHEIDYILNQQNRSIKALLVLKGENEFSTAMAKTVGLPLAISAKLLLNGSIKEKGVKIPTAKIIYRPVLHELKKYGIIFKSID